MAVNKVIYGDRTLVDLTQDSVNEDNLLEGETAHDASGNPIVGRAKTGSGGHVIEDSSGTALTQREVLQFKGVRAYDDPTSGDEKTVIDNTPYNIDFSVWIQKTTAEKEALKAQYPKIHVNNVPGATGYISADLMKKLWQNTNTTVTFASQAVDLSSDDYDFLIFEYYVSKNNNIHLLSQITEKGKGIFLNCAVSSSNGVTSYLRVVDRTNDLRYVFGTCDVSTGTQASQTNNDYIIPVAIYGFKKSVNFTLSALASDVSTSASKCILSDGETSVEEVLNSLDENKAPKIDIATVESGTTASRAYSVGELVYVSGTLYRVKTAIASGATFTVGTNVEVKKVSDAIGDKVNKSGDTISGNLTLDRHSGTASALSTSDLILGNNIPQGTIGNSIGIIDIYGYKQYRTRLYAVNQTADRNIELPNSSGTVALTSNIAFTAVTPTFNTTIINSNTLTGFTLKLGKYLLVNYTFATDAASSGDDPIINFGSSNVAKYASYVLLHPLGNSNAGPAFAAMVANTSYYYVYTSYPMKQSTWYQISAIVEIK